MSTVYEACLSTRRGNHEPTISSLGAFFSREEAEDRLAEARELYAAVVSAPDTVRRYWIEAIDTTGRFQVARPPKPRDRYTTRVEETSPKYHWTHVHVDILDGHTLVGSYDRNYAMLSTFEPFRQGDRHYALISPNYTATSVMDLATGKIVASEEPHAHGFCPVGFYVPDWWDVHTNDALPGCMRWDASYEWPTGDFGLVWGCVWGDDSEWKVQYLDLSRVQDGVIRREERFGYLPIVTHHDLTPDRFIHVVSDGDDGPEVSFEVRREFGLESGRALDDDR